MGKFIRKSAIGRELVLRANVLGISPSEMFAPNTLDPHLYFLINWHGALRLSEEQKKAKDEDESLGGRIGRGRKSRGIDELVGRRGIKRGT